LRFAGRSEDNKFEQPEKGQPLACSEKIESQTLQSHFQNQPSSQSNTKRRNNHWHIDPKYISSLTRFIDEAKAPRIVKNLDNWELLGKALSSPCQHPTFTATTCSRCPTYSNHFSRATANNNVPAEPTIMESGSWTGNPRAADPEPNWQAEQRPTHPYLSEQMEIASLLSKDVLASSSPENETHKCQQYDGTAQTYDSQDPAAPSRTKRQRARLPIRMEMKVFHPEQDINPNPLEHIRQSTLWGAACSLREARVGTLRRRGCKTLPHPRAVARVEQLRQLLRSHARRRTHPPKEPLLPRRQSFLRLLVP